MISHFKISRGLWVLATALLLILAACARTEPPTEPPATTEYELTVTVEGDGGVTSEPAGIDTANGEGTATFEEGTAVTLTATPGEGATFTGWAGDCTGTEACELVMDADQSVTATFTTEEPEPEPEPGTARLTVTKAGNGNGTVAVTGEDDALLLDCDFAEPCTVDVDEGTVLNITATPAEGHLVEITGCEAVDGSCTVTMDAATDVTVTFTDPDAGGPGDGDGDGDGEALFNVSSRDRTEASVTWTPGAWTSNARAEAQRTADLSAIVQEIVDREGWAEGNAMAFIIEGPAGQENVVAHGADSATTQSRWPDLVIVYDDGTSTTHKVGGIEDSAEEIIADGRAGGFEPGSTYTDSDLELTYDTSNQLDQLVGLRFPGVAVPQGATITSAYIQFSAKGTTTGGLPLQITGQAADNAAAFVCGPSPVLCPGAPEEDIEAAGLID